VKHLVGGVAALLLAASPLVAQRGFPSTWVGEWHGTLTTTTPPSTTRNQVSVSLRIAREASGDAYAWRTIFDNDSTRGRRDYRLLVRDEALGFYAIDEGNDVVIEATYVDGALVGVFQVGDRVLESRYELRGDTLTHDITWWSPDALGAAGTRRARGDSTSSVQSFRVSGRQRAVLTRR
jgi:hypothetical protein